MRTETSMQCDADRRRSAQGLDAIGALLFLGAGLVLALVLAPLAAAAAIRIALH